MQVEAKAIRSLPFPVEISAPKVLHPTVSWPNRWVVVAEQVVLMSLERLQVLEVFLVELVLV